MGEIILARHGETEGNVRALAQGHLPLPLTERGRAQARGVARLLLQWRVRPTRLVSSPLPRCMESAHLIADELTLPRPLPDDAFVEMDCGQATGRPYAELPTDITDFASLGGESTETVFARVAAGLDRLSGERSLLLVTHGVIFKAAWAHLFAFHGKWRLALQCGSVLRLRVGGARGPTLVEFSHPAEYRTGPQTEQPDKASEA